MGAERTASRPVTKEEFEGIRNGLRAGQLTARDLAGAISVNPLLAIEALGHLEFLRMRCKDGADPKMRIPVANVVVEQSSEATIYILQNMPWLLGEASDTGQYGWHVAAMKYPRLVLESIIALPREEAETILLLETDKGFTVMQALASDYNDIITISRMMAMFGDMVMGDRRVRHTIMNTLTSFGWERLGEIKSCSEEVTLEQLSIVVIVCRALEKAANELKSLKEEKR